MKVFFVRHGVTQHAQENKGQGPDSPLSEQGIIQARAVAKRLLKEEIDLLFSSELPRTLQTAEVISSEIGKIVQVIPGIHEKLNSPLLHGASFDDPIYQERNAELEKNFGNLDWKFRGEGESLRDVFIRAAQFRDLLVKDYADKNIVVVSHSYFIKSLIVAAVLGNNFCDADAGNLSFAIQIKNTGISLLNYSETSQSWQIVYLNDHFHSTD